MKRQYEAYHVHTCISNCLTQPDSTMTIMDYAKAYRERDMHVLCISEHGNRSDIWNQFDITQRFASEGYKMNALAACEAYFVPERDPSLVKDELKKAEERLKQLEESEHADPFDIIDARKHLKRLEINKSNFHLILIAKNMSGLEQMNFILSEANETGYYYKARIDFELLASLNTKDFICTTACVGGIFKSDEYERLLLRLKEIFGSNLFIEVQHHHQDIQKALNEKASDMSKKYKIPLIYGTDSHYVNHEDAALRKELLRSSGITYEYEDEFDLYLPTANEAYDLLRYQQVLNLSQIDEAMENTLILRDFEGVHFTKERKMPNCMPDKTMEERNKIFKQWVCNGYIERAGMPTKEEAIELHKEMDTITSTDSADYFILHKLVVDHAKEKGGIITQTSRGSAASFATNFALGFTSINRLRCPITLYPDRFISADRLAAGSNPDIDINLANVEAFEEAGKEILGNYGCLPMIAFGTTKTLSSFKLLARAKEIDAETANVISKQIKSYELDVKHAIENNEDNPDYNVENEINIADYVSEQYLDIIEESKQYQGIIVSLSPHPCAHMMLDKDIRREFGVIRVKSKSGNKEPVLCAYIDGTTADGMGYIKSDFLRVDVVNLISDSFALAGQPVLTSQELLDQIKLDRDIWNLYRDGFTMGLNQCEQEKSTEKCMRFKPKNIVELSMFVGGIRPGFKSQVETLLSRKKFDFGIPALDRLLQNESRKDSFIEFDEDIMHIAQYAGISGSESYALIKAVKKKKPEKVKHYRDQFVDGFARKLMEEEDALPPEAQKTAEEIWKIVEGSASYLFNASHAFAMALDSCYGAYLKVHYPYAFYTSMLRMYDKKGKKEKIINIISEMRRYKGIKLIPGKLGQDNRDWYIDKENKTISQSLSSVKYISKSATEDLYKMKDMHFDSFVEVLRYLQMNTCIDSRQYKVLIGIGYFDCFGSANKLMHIASEFEDGVSRITKTLKEKTVQSRIESLKAMEESYADDTSDITLRITTEFENIGLCLSTDDSEKSSAMYYVQAVEDQYSIKTMLYNVRKGTTGRMRVRKQDYVSSILKQGQFIYIDTWSKKPRYRYVDGKRIRVDGESELWLESYRKAI